MDKLKEFWVTGYGRYAKTKAFIRKEHYCETIWIWLTSQLAEIKQTQFH